MMTRLTAANVATRERLELIKALESIKADAVRFCGVTGVCIATPKKRRNIAE
jgi:hypothetical protein